MASLSSFFPGGITHQMLRRAALALFLAVASGAAALAQSGSEGVPSRTYFAYFPIYNEGQYNDALKGYNAESRTSIKGVGGRWIDAICYHTMAGECHYHMGRYTDALTEYTSGLQLFLKYSDWMIRLTPSQIKPAAAGQLKSCPWGRSTRNARIADIPDTLMMGQGRINNNDVLKQGGVVTPPRLIGVNAKEIARCIALSLKRRRELLGPAGPHDPTNAELVAALSRRPVAPNDWKEAWIDVQLALAYSCIGNDGQAKGLLERGLVALGEFDHSLTGMALFELGRIAFSQGDMAKAARAFEEASYAAYQTEDVQLIEESLRYGAMTHLLHSPKGPYPPLELAANFARTQRLTNLQVSCTLSAAEGMANLGRNAEAADLLTAARTAIGRTDMGRGKVGARYGYLSALALYQQGKAKAGDDALAPALQFQRAGGSLWLYHMALVDKLRTSGAVSERVAMALYENVLREPQPADWTTDPLESLSVLVTPHTLPFEHWFETALERKEYERALEISDLLRRHRFLSLAPMGGRLLALKWLLEGPEDLLDQDAKLQKQDLLNRHPLYSDLARQIRQLRDELSQQPLVPDDETRKREQSDKLAKIATLSAAQELLLREVAVRREPCSMIFPPKRTLKEVRASLGEGQAMLVFLLTSRQLYAFLIDQESYPNWEIGSLANLKKQTEDLLRKMQNHENNHVVSLAEFRDGNWADAAVKLRNTLFKSSKATFPGKIEELVIVPDSFLWYLPFESLLVGDKNPQPLIHHTRVRYSPTIALALPDSRGRKPSANTAVVAGKLFPGQSESVTHSALDQMSQAVPGMVALRSPLPAPSSIYSVLFDRLLVMDDIHPPEGSPLSWTPVTLDKSPQGTLESWMGLPFGGPDQVLLPAFHTPAENSLKKLPLTAAGNDLFYSSCALLASGTRTVLISRWRTGGQSSIDLSREFLQELPHATASAAWQRSVFITLDSPLVLDQEPRVKATANDAPPTASHPFFWAGYLLIDNGSSPSKSDEAPQQKIELKPVAKNAKD